VHRLRSECSKVSALSKLPCSRKESRLEGVKKKQMSLGGGGAGGDFKQLCLLQGSRPATGKKNKGGRRRIEMVLERRETKNSPKGEASERRQRIVNHLRKRDDSAKHSQAGFGVKKKSKPFLVEGSGGREKRGRTSKSDGKTKARAAESEKKAQLDQANRAEENRRRVSRLGPKNQEQG